jgi:[ribosomal protein S5]-alanine N-acetyltransferase
MPGMPVESCLIKQRSLSQTATAEAAGKKGGRQVAFLRTNIGPETCTVRGARTGLRPLLMSDFSAWAELRELSRDHLTPYEPTWLHDELKKNSYRRRVRHYQREQRDDLGYAFAIVRSSDDVLVGGISLSNVRRGVTQTASLGYWLGLPFVHQGLMADAVAAIVPHAIYGLRLHRLEAATLPGNERSIKVLERNGFRREGFARRFLKIDGVWSDHILFGIVAEDLQAGASVVRERDDVAALP